MSALEGLQKTLYSYGRDHVRFDGETPRKTTSNFLTRWFNRMCAYWCESSKKANRAVCSTFLQLVTKDNGDNALKSFAQKTINEAMRHKVSRPLSGRRAARVIGDIIDHVKKERQKELAQYWKEMHDAKSELYLLNIIEKGPKPTGGLPLLEGYLQKSADRSAFDMERTEMGVYLLNGISRAPRSVGGLPNSAGYPERGMNPTKEEKARLCKNIDIHVFAEITSALRNQYLTRAQAITREEVRTTAMRVMVERELRFACFGPDWHPYSPQRANFDFFVMCLKSHGISAPDWERYQEMVNDVIKHVAENWTDDPGILKKSAPLLIAVRLVREICRKEENEELKGDLIRQSASNDL